MSKWDTWDEFTEYMEMSGRDEDDFFDYIYEVGNEESPTQLDYETLQVFWKQFIEDEPY